MVHPIYMAVLRRPDLLVKHAANYVALLRESATDVVRGMAGKAVAWAIAGICSFLGLAFAGIAVMLSLLQNRFRWVLVAVPAITLLLGCISAILAMHPVVKKEIHDVTVELGVDKRAMDFARETRND